MEILTEIVPDKEKEPDAYRAYQFYHKHAYSEYSAKDEIEDLKKQIKELKDKIDPPKKKVTYWANIYVTGDLMYVQKSFIWESEDKAIKSIGKSKFSDYKYVKTISFEIEE